MAPRASSVPDTPMSALPLLLASLAVLAPLGSSGARPASQYIESAALNGTVPLLAAPSYSNRVASLGATYMDCDDAPVCGVLTLETGWGGGYYAHNYPVVHGLWPQTPPYGNSACLRPKSSAGAIPWRSDHPELLQCYKEDLPKHYTKQDYSQEYGFAEHEWEKHGRCAGVTDADAFLDTVCGLAEAPLRDMKEAEGNGAKTISEVASALRDKGYPVYYVDEGYGKQVELSACAGADGLWRLAAPEEFSALCGTGKPRPPAPPPAEECVHMQRGPPCSDDVDCQGLPGCVRCANSGFCTDVRILEVA